MTHGKNFPTEAACMNTFSSDDNLDKCDSTDNGNSFIILGGWFDSYGCN